MWVTINIKEKDIKLNTELISLMCDEKRTVSVVSGTVLELSEKDYNELQATMFPTRKKVAKVNEEAAEFLTQLHNLVGGKGKALASPKRLKALSALLAIDGMTKDKLITAATNIGNDEWLQGENDNHKRYGDIDYLLRPDKATKYAEMDTSKKRKKMF